MVNNVWTSCDNWRSTTYTHAAHKPDYILSLGVLMMRRIWIFHRGRLIGIKNRRYMYSQTCSKRSPLGQEQITTYTHAAHKPDYILSLGVPEEIYTRNSSSALNMIQSNLSIWSPLLSSHLYLKVIFSRCLPSVITWFRLIGFLC
jgi:hypothetical protein